MISKIFSIRNYIMKQLLKTNESGIMKLPDKGNVDFGEMIIKEDLFKKGIDPHTITSESQLDTILNTPHVPTKPKKTGEVIDVDFGNWPEKKAGGGRTGSGLNYLLGEDDQNSRVPYGEGLKVYPKVSVLKSGETSNGLDVDVRDTTYGGTGIYQGNDWFGGAEGLTGNVKVDVQQEGNTVFKDTMSKEDTVNFIAGLGNIEGDKAQVKFDKDLNNVSIVLKKTFADGGRARFGGGGLGRRAFLKLMAALGATGVAAKSGLVTLFKGGAKKQIVKDLTSVPIKNPPGMPDWFKPLVNRVIKEGDDVTKKLATGERQIVHTKKLDEFDEVTVTQDLNTGNVRVEYHGSGNMGEAPIQLDYKASEWIEPKITKKGQIAEPGMKTSDEFSAVESEPRVTNWDGDIEWDGENVVSKVDDLLTDTTKLETYATGKNPNIKKLLKSEQKQKKVNKLNEDQMEQAEYIEQKYGPGPDPTDFFDEKDLGKNFASGGRVPLDGGGSTVDPDWDDMDPDEWLHIIKLLRAGEFGAAEGGRVPMWMGGGLSKGKELLRNMVKYFAKNSEIGKTPSEYLKISNPKQYQKLLNDISIYKKYSPGEGIMAPQIIEDMIKKTGVERAGIIEHLIGAARNIKKADDSIIAYKKQMLDDMVKRGADKKSAEFISEGMSKAIDVKDTPKITDEALLELETIYKNMLMKEGRQLNATGGRVPLAGGKKAVLEGLEALFKKFFPGTTKLGQTSKPLAEKTQLRNAIAAFQERQAAKKLKVWENPDKVRAAVDDIFSSGDYKMDAEMAAEALVENNPAAFGGKLIDDIDDATRSDIYGAVLRVVQSDLAKTLQLKRLSRPKKTLEGIEKTGTINISDEGVADEFTRFMKESDPKGHRKIEEIVEITNFDPKGRKKNASGGLAGMLGE